MPRPITARSSSNQCDSIAQTHPVPLLDLVQNRQYSAGISRQLFHPRNDYRHIVGLFGSACPFVGGLHQPERYRAGSSRLQPNRRFTQAVDAKLLAVDVFPARSSRSL